MTTDNFSSDVLSFLQNQQTISDPVKYAMVVQAAKSEAAMAFKDLIPQLETLYDSYSKKADKLSKISKDLKSDSFAVKKKTQNLAFANLDEQMGLSDGKWNNVIFILDAFYSSMRDIIRVLLQSSELIGNARIVSFDHLKAKTHQELTGVSSELGQNRVDAILKKFESETEDSLKSLALEQQINSGTVNGFLQGIRQAATLSQSYVNLLHHIEDGFVAYFERLRRRHSNDGVAVVNNKVLMTDIAIMVWENVDRTGEIQDGTGEQELSMYTVNRASALIRALRDSDIAAILITDPIKYLLSEFTSAEPIISKTSDMASKMLQSLGDRTIKTKVVNTKNELVYFADMMESIDLSQIQSKPPETALSKTEKFALDHYNKSIEKVCNSLWLGDDLNKIAVEILKLKTEEQKFYTLENSFYVCKIGNGNPFSGKAPGALEVIPGERPSGKFENIWGGGFDELRDFISGMKDAGRWDALFLATSPSSSTDKNNILLVGPQGCGKSQCLRAIGAEPDSISIFAVGSDFGTCWAHESQKNPKRLFQEAIKLRKSSGRPVHILIDEIDMVLHNDNRGSSTNLDLRLEFQNLMDGVVAYPGITIWGATNNPERIPTPMLRRFAKVMIVGEMSSKDRVTTLKYYLENYLPCGFLENSYEKWSNRLDGATGDVIRKVADGVWLKLMRAFVSKYPEESEKLLEGLKASQGGKVFEISSISDEMRQEIKSSIGAKLMVDQQMVDHEIHDLLQNIAINQQINVAKQTYQQAHELISSINQK